MAGKRQECPECGDTVLTLKGGSLRKHPCNPLDGPTDVVELRIEQPEPEVEPAVPAVDATIPKFRIG